MIRISKLFRVCTFLTLAIGIVLFNSKAATAHNSNETYIYVDVKKKEVSGRIEMRRTDLNIAFRLDINGDGEVQDTEIETAKARILSAFNDSLTFDISGIVPKITFTHTTNLGEGVDGFVLFHFDLDYNGSIPDEISVTYKSTFSQSLIGHRSMVILHSNYRTGLDKNEASISHIFSNGFENARINLLGEKPWSVFGRFIKLGFWHILFGFDHVAFLLALLLPSVLIARANIWQPADTIHQAGWSIIKIATVFTIAHSITLSLAALGIFVPSVTIIESLIALSIVAAAALNIFAVRPTLTLPIVFALGLLHGFGFSYVMEPLGVARQTLIQSLIGFNIGVELGQLSIIIAVFPVLFLMRRQRWYLPIILCGGSILLIAVACYWFGARALSLLQSLLQI